MTALGARLIMGLGLHLTVMVERRLAARWLEHHDRSSAHRWNRTVTWVRLREVEAQEEGADGKGEA